MRAVTAWLEAADAAAHVAAKHEHESQHASQPHDYDTLRTLTAAPEAVAAAASSVSKRGAESTIPVTPIGAGLARGFLNPRGSQSSQSAVPVGLSESQQLPPQSQEEYQQVVAVMTQSLLQQYHDQEQHQQQQQQQQQLPALTAEEPAAGFAALEGMHPDPDASTPPTSTASPVPDDDAAGEGAQAAENAAAAASGDTGEADEADADAADTDAQQLAAAERQRIVDEAVEKLFETSADMLPLDPAAADLGGSASESSNVQQGLSGDSGSAHSAHSSHSRDSADSASAATDASAATSGEETEVQDEGEGDREVAGVLNTLGLQGAEGLQAAVQSVLLPPRSSSITQGEPSAAGKDKMVQQIPEHRIEQIAAPGSSSEASLPDGAFELAQGADAQSSHTELRGETQGLLGAGHASVPGQARGLPPLTPARGHSTAQQGAAAARTSFRSTTAQQPLLSQDQMQTLVNEMFNIGYETMGQLATGSIATPAPAAAPPTCAASGPVVGSASGTAAGSAAPVPAEAGAEAGAGAAAVDSTGRSQDELQTAFNRLVANSLQQQAQTASQSAAVIPSSEVAAANRVAAVQLPAPMVSAPAPAPTVSAPAPAPTVSAPAPAPMVSAPAPAANAYLQRDQDHLPRRLVAREAERLRQVVDQGYLPRHHSVFSSRNNDRVNAVTEQRVCPRQVGFGTQMRQRHAWVKHVVKGLFGLAAVGLAAGFASGKIQWHRASTESKKGNLSDTDPAEEYDTDSDDFWLH